MKKIIFRKFILDVTAFFVITILVMGLIVWTLQAINYFDFVTEDGHGLKVYFLYTFLNFPKIIHRILPFVFFISLFLTIIKYESNDQLNIFWLNGISKIKFINVVIFFSIMIMLFQIFLGSYLSPLTQFKARKLIKDSNISFFTNLIKEGKFINVVKGLTIFIEKKESGDFSNIFIEDSSRGFSRITFAKNGRLDDYSKSRKFLLFNGKVLNIDKSRINTFEFDQINFNLDTFDSNSITAIKIQEENSLNLISCLEVFNIYSKYKCEDQNTLKEIKQELLKRFFKPIFIPVIGLFCCFIFITSKSKPNYIKVRRYIFLITLSIIIVSETSLRYSTDSFYSLSVYVSIPLILIIFFYCYSFFRINNV